MEDAVSYRERGDLCADTDLLEKHTVGARLASVKTTNMGSLYKLRYPLRMKDPDAEKEFSDELRCRNGNLEIQLGIAVQQPEEL